MAEKENAVATMETSNHMLLPAKAQEVVYQVAAIQELMKSVMKEGEHYGKIPGCGDKPSLLKPGAEKLNLVFRMAPEYDITETELPGGHREYKIICSLYTIQGHTFLGQGVGVCSTMETKWRYRTGPKESTDKPVPSEYWNVRKSDPPAAQKLLGGKGFMVGKDDSGQWMICKGGEKVEHDNPADYLNTCLKIGKKRSHVDATLTVTGASDIFTQDLEDLKSNNVIVEAQYEVKEEKKTETKTETKAKAKAKPKKEAPTPYPPKEEPMGKGMDEGPIDTFAGEPVDMPEKEEIAEGGTDSGDIYMKIVQGHNMFVEKAGLEEADRILFDASAFDGKDGPVGFKGMAGVERYANGKGTEEKKKKWMGSTLGKLRTAWEELEG